MADELTISAKLQCVNGFVDEKDDDASFTVTQTTLSSACPGFWPVGTTEESTTFADLTTPRWVKIKNLDVTNYVEFGASTGVYLIRLKPGESCVFPLAPSVTLYAKANVATVNITCRCYDA